MADDTYDLAELCAAVGVTPRTVRYYVQQGLLPAPGARGPGARYDGGHRDRLQLIKRLQREHLPLAEIRARLAALDDEAVAALLHEPAGAPQRGSALEYVRQVLAGRPTGPTPAAAPPPPSERAGSTLVKFARMRPSERASELADALAAAPPSDADPRDRRRAALPDATLVEPVPPGPARSTWERIALGPDVELHVRRPLSRPQNKMVERLVALARSLAADPD